MDWHWISEHNTIHKRDHFHLPVTQLHNPNARQSTQTPKNVSTGFILSSYLKDVPINFLWLVEVACPWDLVKHKYIMCSLTVHISHSLRSGLWATSKSISSLRRHCSLQSSSSQAENALLWLVFQSPRNVVIRLKVEHYRTSCHCLLP